MRDGPPLPFVRNVIAVGLAGFLIAGWAQTCFGQQQTRRDRILTQTDRALAGVERASSADSLAYWTQRLGELSAAWDALGGAPVSVPPPNPDPGEPPATDARMIRGAYPLLGPGSAALAACAPPGGGDWNVELLTVDVADRQTENAPGSRGPVLESMDPSADLTVVVYTTGGQNRGAPSWTRVGRRRCVLDAAHTAPETYYQAGGEHVRGGGISDYVTRGLGLLPRREDGGVFPSNYFLLECGRDVHVDQMSVAFASNDQVRTVGGIGNANCSTERASVLRIVNGPTGGGTSGRGGGPSGDECGEQTWGWIFAFENQRRNPDVGCRGRVDVTNVLCYNTTDCGRYGDFISGNLRGVLVVGGPVSNCAMDEALTWYEGNRNNLRNQLFTSSLFLESIESRPGPGCSWPATSSLWGAPHTVFHYSVQQTSVPFVPHGVSEAFPDPDYPVVPLPPALLESAVPSNVGANFRLNCEGLWEHRPNDLDGQSFERFRNRQGRGASWESLIQYEAETGRQVETPAGTPCPDSNGNGIPDSIEARWGHSDPGRLGSSGRPVVLEWLEGYGRVGG